MFLALYGKELRSIWRFGIPVVLAYGYWIAGLIMALYRDTTSTFEDSDRVLYLQITAISFGLVLGLWQTLPEMAMGTAPFLLQTARRREAILGAKLAAGFTLFGGLLAVPLALAVSWDIRWSTHYFPLGWGDSLYLWISVWAGACAYLGGLAIGVRGLWSGEVPRQLGGVLVFGLGIFLGLAFSDAIKASIALGVTTILSLAWLWSGYFAREF